MAWVGGGGRCQAGLQCHKQTSSAHCAEKSSRTSYSHRGGQKQKVHPCHSSGQMPSLMTAHISSSQKQRPACVQCSWPLSTRSASELVLSRDDQENSSKEQRVVGERENRTGQVERE